MSQLRLSGNLSGFDREVPNDVAVAVAEKQSDFTPVGQVSLQDAPPQPAPVTQTAPASTAPTTSPELVHQLEGMARISSSCGAA